MLLPAKDRDPKSKFCVSDVQEQRGQEGCHTETSGMDDTRSETSMLLEDMNNVMLEDLEMDLAAAESELSDWEENEKDEQREMIAIKVNDRDQGRVTDTETTPLYKEEKERDNTQTKEEGEPPELVSTKSGDRESSDVPRSLEGSKEVVQVDDGSNIQSNGEDNLDPNQDGRTQEEKSSRNGDIGIGNDKPDSDHQELTDGSHPSLHSKEVEIEGTRETRVDAEELQRYQVEDGSTQMQTEDESAIAGASGGSEPPASSGPRPRPTGESPERINPPEKRFRPSESPGSSMRTRVTVVVRKKITRTVKTQTRNVPEIDLSEDEGEEADSIDGARYRVARQQLRETLGKLAKEKKEREKARDEADMYRRREEDARRARERAEANVSRAHALIRRYQNQLKQGSRKEPGEMKADERSLAQSIRQQEQDTIHDLRFRVRELQREIEKQNNEIELQRDEIRDWETNVDILCDRNKTLDMTNISLRTEIRRLRRLVPAEEIAPETVTTEGNEATRDSSGPDEDHDGDISMEHVEEVPKPDRMVTVEGGSEVNIEVANRNEHMETGWPNLHVVDRDRQNVTIKLDGETRKMTLTDETTGNQSQREEDEHDKASGETEDKIDDKPKERQPPTSRPEEEAASSQPTSMETDQEEPGKANQTNLAVSDPMICEEDKEYDPSSPTGSVHFDLGLHDDYDLDGDITGNSDRTANSQSQRKEQKMDSEPARIKKVNLAEVAASMKPALSVTVNVTDKEKKSVVLRGDGDSETQMGGAIPKVKRKGNTHTESRGGAPLERNLDRDRQERNLDRDRQEPRYRSSTLGRGRSGERDRTRNVREEGPVTPREEDRRERTPRGRVQERERGNFREEGSYQNNPFRWSSRDRARDRSYSRDRTSSHHHGREEDDGEAAWEADRRRPPQPRRWAGPPNAVQRTSGSHRNANYRDRDFGTPNLLEEYMALHQIRVMAEVRTQATVFLLGDLNLMKIRRENVARDQIVYRRQINTAQELALIAPFFPEKQANIIVTWLGQVDMVSLCKLTDSRGFEAARSKLSRDIDKAVRALEPALTKDGLAIFLQPAAPNTIVNKGKIMAKSVCNNIRNAVVRTNNGRDRLQYIELAKLIHTNGLRHNDFIALQKTENGVMEIFDAVAMAHVTDILQTEIIKRAPQYFKKEERVITVDYIGIRKGVVPDDECKLEKLLD